MKSIKHLFIFSILIWVGSVIPAPAQTVEKLSLRDAEAIALKNYPLLKSAEYFASAAQQGITEARSAYFPNAFGSLTGVGADRGSRLAAGGLNNPIIFNRYANGVTVSQLVTDFGRTKNLVKSSRFEAQAQQANVVATRADVLLRVDRAYYAALRAQAVLHVGQETVKSRQLVVDQVTALEKSKLKSSLDVSFANVNLAEADLFLVQAKDDLQAAFADLSRALGYPDQHVFDLTQEIKTATPPPELSQMVVDAMRDRPELANQRFNLQSAQSFAKAERDLWMPTISFLGSAGWVPDGQSALPDHYAAAGVNVNIPIFNGKLFSARRAEADLRAQAVDQNLKDLELRINRDVRVAWLNLNTAYQRLDLTSKLLDQASQALKLAQARYNLGLSSIVELSQAQLNETQAELEQGSAEYEYKIRTAELDYQAGLLH